MKFIARSGGEDGLGRDHAVASARHCCRNRGVGRSPVQIRREHQGPHAVSSASGVRQAGRHQAASAGAKAGRTPTPVERQRG